VRIRTLGHICRRIRPVPVARQPILHPLPLPIWTHHQLLLKQVDLVREEHDRRLREKLGTTYTAPKEERVLEPVHARVLLELLVEAGDGCKEDDGGDVLEEGNPGVALRRVRSVGCSRR
jgi:hypothetical protein